MGFLDFDGKRYWDVREPEKWYFAMNEWESDPLPSDSTRRLDVTTFKTKTVELAQEQKDIIEQQAVRDEELRASALEKRNLN